MRVLLALAVGVFASQAVAAPCVSYGVTHPKLFQLATQPGQAVTLMQAADGTWTASDWGLLEQAQTARGAVPANDLVAWALAQHAAGTLPVAGAPTACASGATL